ncbi:hypothetical protein [Phyllobacterium calauticae]|jgi:peptide/nickel transport system substrate-binding protein|uniref:hypothetical protein n=1 Tax=Phyllobacterium calauticae TaxID=2817027 RepID=UPI001CBED99A|nr:hypothetical protein [Phyllobacterium calauticae]
MKRKYIIPASALVALLLSNAVSAEELIRICSPYVTTTLDPIRSASAGNIEAFGQLYARLLRRDPSGQRQPELAEK